MITTDILIIGGGLSGLALADLLQRAGVEYHLVEARPRFGGRIKVLQSAGGNIDLGPSWFWPGQPRIAQMVQRLELSVFDQFATGALSYENERGEVLRNQGWASMQGSLRLEGGMARLIDSLVNELPKEKLTKNLAIGSLIRTGDKIDAIGVEGELAVRARKVALAIPPRVVSKMRFEPALPAIAQRTMLSTPTWMAGHAKFVAVYNKPFWREDGLSGDAMSRYGPMIEMHDASGPQDGSGALFGFLGVPASSRANQRQAIIDACLAQFTRIFGSQAQTPLHAYLQDWAFEPETAIDEDQVPPSGHPSYGMPAAFMGLWDGQLHFTSTEVASQFGGFLEGALEAAENAAPLLNAVHAPNLD